MESEEKIIHIRGPNGEIVVVSPIKNPSVFSGKSKTYVCCVFFAAFCYFIFVALLIIGFIFWIMTVINDDVIDGVNPGLIVMAVGGIFFFLPCPMICYLENDHKKQVQKYMHIDANSAEAPGNEHHMEPYQRRDHQREATGQQAHQTYNPATAQHHLSFSPGDAHHHQSAASGNVHHHQSAASGNVHHHQSAASGNVHHHQYFAPERSPRHQAYNPQVTSQQGINQQGLLHPYTSQDVFRSSRTPTPTGSLQTNL